jgi:hypothetical protein
VDGGVRRGRSDGINRTAAALHLNGGNLKRRDGSDCEFSPPGKSFDAIIALLLAGAAGLLYERCLSRGLG